MPVSPHTFPPTARLRTQAQFRHVFSKTNTLKNKGFRLLWRQNDLESPRLGAIIPKREIPLAVNRNQLRRRIRESFRLHQQQLGAHDVIILVKRSALDLSSAEFKQSLEQLWAGLTAS